MHENNQIPSFSLQIFNLREKIIFKHILVNASSNGALRKKERAYNTGTEQPTPNIHFHRTTNILMNFIFLLGFPNSAIMLVNSPIHMKSHLICDTDLV
jgi:DNA polymerase III alpha subunit (gram-positive type)